MDTILETLKKQIATLLEEKNFVMVAIDGKCTSGKNPAVHPVLPGKPRELKFFEQKKSHLITQVGFFQ